MTNNIKKKCINIGLLLLIAVLILVPGSSALPAYATRAIENGVLTAGGNTSVTVTINNNNTQSLSLKETVSSGLTLTRGTDDADQFKASTNEWVWLTAKSGDKKTVTYEVTVPFGTTPGIYNIGGAIATSNTTTDVTGDKTIEVKGASVADTTAPTTVLSGVIEGVTYTNSAIVTLIATDNVGGSGVKNTTYSLNGTAMVIYSAPITVTNIGKNNLTYMSTDNAGNVENVKTVNFTINSDVSVGSFGFVVTPLSATVHVGDVARYNLTLTNTGNVVDTYNLVANKPSNTTVTLSENNATVGQGNSAVVELTVVGSETGTYTVTVNATSKADVNNSKTVTATTNVIISVLAIENLKSVPNSAISKSNPAKISADVIRGISDILFVHFGIVDYKNITGGGANNILLISENLSGAEGLYKDSWPGNYVTLGNVAVTEVVSANIDYTSGLVNIRGAFKENLTSNDTEAILSFNVTTGSLSNVTNFYPRKPLTIQNAESTFRSRAFTYVNTNEVSVLENISKNTFTLYDMTGNVAIDNPRITVKAVPNGQYEVYAFVTDVNNSNATSGPIYVDTIPVYNGGGGGDGGGTYPTITPTPKKNVTVVPTTTEIPMPTVTAVQTPVRPVETTSEAPIEPTATKGSPGIGAIAVIGIIGTIYIIRRRK
jgi:hypothetical protein